MPSLYCIISAQVHVAWLAAGMLLAIILRALATRGWFNILRGSFPRARELRWRDAMAASFAAGGVNGIVPGRPGNLVKLAVVHRRIGGACYATLIGTALPEMVFESLCGLSLMVWMVLVAFSGISAHGAWL